MNVNSYFQLHNNNNKQFYESFNYTNYTGTVDNYINVAKSPSIEVLIDNKLNNFPHLQQSTKTPIEEQEVNFNVLLGKPLSLHNNNDITQFYEEEIQKAKLIFITCIILYLILAITFLPISCFAFTLGFKLKESGDAKVRFYGNLCFTCFWITLTINLFVLLVGLLLLFAFCSAISHSNNNNG
ncbi:hypothetical protein ABK040_011063 [Willaertia magna]